LDEATSKTNTLFDEEVTEAGVVTRSLSWIDLLEMIERTFCVFSKEIVVRSDSPLAGV
jgi:hypothetical protein